MASSNGTKVLIGGKVYTLAGNESEEYIQKVALYINNKIDELTETDNAKQLNTRLLSVLLDINIADDFFKEKEKSAKLKERVEQQIALITDLRNTITGLNKQLEEAQANTSDKEVFLTKKVDTLQKEVERLTEEATKYKCELEEYIELFDNEEVN